MPPERPLAELIAVAAAGRFPVADGGWRSVPPWRPGLGAIIAFTGLAVFAVRRDVPGDLLASLGADGLGGAHDPRLITALAGPGGWIDSLDMLMAARGTERAGVPPGSSAGLTSLPIHERHSRPGSVTVSGSWVTGTGAARLWPLSAGESLASPS